MISFLSALRRSTTRSGGSRLAKPIESRGYGACLGGLGGGTQAFFLARALRSFFESFFFGWPGAFGLPGLGAAGWAFGSLASPRFAADAAACFFRVAGVAEVLLRDPFAMRHTREGCLTEMGVAGITRRVASD